MMMMMMMMMTMALRQRMIRRKQVRRQNQRLPTGMHVFDVPREQAIEQRVEDHHENHQLEAVLVVFHRRHGHVVPLDADALDLVEREVLGAQTERRRRQYRLSNTYREHHLVDVI